MNQLGDSLQEPIADLITRRLWYSFSVVLRDSHLLWDSLGDPLGVSLWASLRVSLWDSLMEIKL